MTSPSLWLKETSWMTSLVWVWSCALQPWVTSELPLQETLGRVAESGLPALLLQCLYLFFVFPLETDELLESDVQVQRMLVQVSRGRAGLPGPRPSCFLVLQPACPTSSGLSLPLALSLLYSTGGPSSPLHP